MKQRFTLFSKINLTHRAAPLAALAVVTGVTVPVLAVGVDTYDISDGVTTEQVSVYQADAQDALAHSSFNEDEYNIISVTDNGDGQFYVAIKQKYDITITADGKTVSYHTGDNLVSTILRQVGIKVGENDLVEPSLNTKITSPTDIKIIRVTKKKKTEIQSIPYTIETRTSDQLYVGDTRIAQEGINGSEEITTEYTYYDGEEVSSVEVSTEVIADPVIQIIENGTKPIPSSPVTANNSTNTTGSRSGQSTAAAQPAVQASGSTTITYSRMLTVEATAYSGGGLTASGTSARVGAIAVDPKVIPLGSRLYITSEDGTSWIYGYAVAEDTGGAIKGNRIDLYFDTEAQCEAFGRRSAKVYVLT